MIEFPVNPEYQPETTLNVSEIVANMQEIGLDVEVEDFDGLDDNEILGVLASHAVQMDMEIDAFFDAVGVPVAEA